MHRIVAAIARRHRPRSSGDGGKLALFIGALRSSAPWTRNPWNVGELRRDGAVARLHPPRHWRRCSQALPTSRPPRSAACRIIMTRAALALSGKIPETPRLFEQWINNRARLRRQSGKLALEGRIALRLILVRRLGISATWQAQAHCVVPFLDCRGVGFQKR